MRIAFIGKFENLYDEEYIALSFEKLGHELLRLNDNLTLTRIIEEVDAWHPDILLFCKYEPYEGGPTFYRELMKRKIKSVCWIFDLYIGYPRQYRIYSASFFRADSVFTTDGGHDDVWAAHSINHKCVRQGIYEPECVLYPFNDPQGVAFVGSENALYPKRTEMIKAIRQRFSPFSWYGRKNTNELRGLALNELYAKTKIIIGDSVYSPHYWSNRVVETLGRGGFLIHQEVEGLKEAYPYLVTYKRGALDDLYAKIDYYLEHEEERQQIVRLNHQYVLDNYTMDKKCAELLSLI